MRRFQVLLLVLAVSAGLAVRSEAGPISLFMNSSYVDTGTEGANLQTTLTNLGHTVTTFTGISAAAFTAAGAGGAIIFFPEMEMGNLFSALDAPAIAALQGFVSGGGGLIQANYFVANRNLANGLFGYALSQTGNLGVATSLNAGAAAGTPFAGGPATLPAANAVEGILTSSLPGGALNLYSSGLSTSVFATTYGSGRYVYLGYDWFGGQVADWSNVTDRAVAYAGSAAPVPEPASLLLVAVGCGALWRRRNRRS